MLERTPGPERDSKPDAVQPAASLDRMALMRSSVGAASLVTRRTIDAGWRAAGKVGGVLDRDARLRVIAALSFVGLGIVGLVASAEMSLAAGSALLVMTVAAVALVAGRRTSTRPHDSEAVTAASHRENNVPDLPASGAPSSLSSTPLPAIAAVAQPTVIDRGHAILAAIPDAALVADRAGLIVETNPLVAEMFPRGRPGLLVNQMCRSPEVVDAVERALVSGRVVVEIEEWVPVRRKLLMTVVALDTASEVPPAPQPALLIVFRDVSEQEKLAQMRADFIANASHELRTPLASLRGFVETLQGPARDDPVARERFLSIMATQASRMTRLIDDLLSLSRVEMRVHVPPTGTVDLQDVAVFVVQTMEPIATASEARITLIKTDTPARIRGERDELVQVVQNLVHNALKYGRPKGGLITLRLLRQTRGPTDRRRITLEVEDDGPGIAAVHLPRLTERFYRVSPTISRDRGGTGLGLAIVKNIVNRHRGELGIRSDVQNGSVFSISFDELPASPK